MVETRLGGYLKLRCHDSEEEKRASKFKFDMVEGF